MSGPPATAQHGDPARYRRGCRCTDCRIAHAEESARWKFEKRFGDKGPMGPKVRAEILVSLRTTKSVRDTAAALGLTHQAIYGACQAIPEFGDQVDELTRVVNK